VEYELYMVYGRRGLRNGFLSFLYGEFWRRERDFV
jgi:hypothetical protein